MNRLAPSLAAAAMTLSGCNLAPPYVRPAPPVPAGWPAGDAYLRQSEASLPAVTYRDIFRDPALQALIDQALANNRDLRVAAANITIARGTYRVQRAQQLPQIGASAGVTAIDRASNGITTGVGTGAGTGTSSGGVDTRYEVGIGLSNFELDLFGRLRNLSAAALDEYFATESAARATRLSLVGELAAAWATLAADRSLLAIARDTEASATRTVSLTRARLEGGIAPRTDLSQAETVLAQARFDRATLTTAIAQDRNAIELLVGAPVADANLPASLDVIETSVAELPAGLDSRVLLRRPDVVQAEYGLRAATARIGAARAAFFPTIGLTAAAGLASTALSSLFSGGAFSWSAGPAASLPIFDGGANAGNLTAARGQRDAALAGYERAIQIAFREVADALAQRGTIDAQLAAQAELERAARDTYRLNEARYREGIDPFLNSLDAHRSLYAAQRSRAATRLARVQNLVTLYRVLGGDQLTDVTERR